MLSLTWLVFLFLLGSSCQRLSIEVPANSPPAPPAVLDHIEIFPSSKNMPKDVYFTLQAIGYYSDSSTGDVTSSCDWVSNDPSIVDFTGSTASLAWVVGKNAGSTEIIATYQDLSAQTSLSISAASLVSISLSPNNSSVAKGLTQQFTANGTYSDLSTVDISSTVTWTSDDVSKVTINDTNPTKGFATTVNQGGVIIQATLGAINGTTNFTVNPPALLSIAVTPANSTVAIAANKQFTATGTYTDSSVVDLTTSVIWTSSNPTFVTISNTSGTQGQATGVAIGTTIITATLGSISGQTNLNGVLF